MFISYKLPELHLTKAKMLIEKTDLTFEDLKDYVLFTTDKELYQKLKPIVKDLFLENNFYPKRSFLLLIQNEVIYRVTFFDIK